MIVITDMEGAALAVLARRGALTSYAVARAFAESPSEFWSGSAGAVYPMLRRLRARGFVSASQGADGERSRTRYSVTAKGRAAFEGWLLDVERGAGWGFDPLRTRAMELDLVSPAAGKRFLRAALARTEQLLANGGGRFHARERAVRVAWLRARVTWIKAALKA